MYFQQNFQFSFYTTDHNMQVSLAQKLTYKNDLKQSSSWRRTHHVTTTCFDKEYLFKEQKMS